MFAYYIDLAWRSLKRSPGLTILMVLSIGCGVAMAMATWSLDRMMSRDPIPEKSAQLYVPQLDMWGPSAHVQRNMGNDLPLQLDYPDAVALMRDHRARLQSAIYEISPSVVPVDPTRHPVDTFGFAVSSEFFPMLDVPFRYGSGWSDADDAHRAQVVVIDSELNDQVFGGGNSVGKSMQVDGHEYRVVGVLKHWNPQPEFFSVPDTGGFTSHDIGILLPFGTAIAAGMTNEGNTNCQNESPTGFAALQRSHCVWINYMAELGNAAQAAAYRRYLVGFAHQRYSWPPRVGLHDLMGWLGMLQVVPGEVGMLRLVAFGLLIVCIVDTVGLLLAKFLRRSGEIGVRRALGASRRAICAQFLVESALIGLSGGVVGLLLTKLVLAWMGAHMPTSFSMLTRFDFPLFGVTVLVAIGASLAAALYPALRAAYVQPSWQLKSN